MRKVAKETIVDSNVKVSSQAGVASFNNRFTSQVEVEVPKPGEVGSPFNARFVPFGGHP